MDTNIKHKDRLFIFLFGNESYKQWTLNLYNAINHSNYDDPEDIKFNTLDDFLYMGMKNDVSFIINGQISLFEHQSTFNPNMPLRQFLYLAHIYEGLVQGGRESLYRPVQLVLPTPKLYVLYNGTKEEDEERVLYLSDAFESEGDIEVRVKIININYGHNKKLLHDCKQLKEYSWLIETIRNNMDNSMNLSEAIDDAIKKMPDDFSIKKEILQHQAEVKGMLFSEANNEYEMNKLWDQIRRESREEARKEAREEARKEVHKEDREHFKTVLLEDGFSEEKVNSLIEKLLLKEKTEE